MLFACGSNDDDKPMDPPFDDGGPQEQMVPCDPDTPEFTTGMSNGLKASDAAGDISVRIDQAPKPPEKGYNTWEISVLDGAGEPNAGARLNWACAWMAVHGHGSNPQTITSLGDGRFKLEKTNFLMTGPWEVQLWVDGKGEGPEYMPQNGAAVAAGLNCMPTNGAKPSPNIKFKLCVPQSGTGK